MIMKTFEPTEYQAYLLDVENRIILDDLDTMNLKRFHQGYDGEFLFYDMIKDIEGCIVLWDISLETPGRAQFDFIVITDDCIFHFDVKNFSGKYTYKDGNFISSKQYVSSDVIPRLKWGHQVMRQFLAQSGIDFSYYSKVVFINETFQLKGFEASELVLFAKDVDKVRDYLSSKKLITQEMIDLGNELLYHHNPNNYFERIHYYSVEEMRKGVRCIKCRRIGMRHYKGEKYMKCQCGFKESNVDVILRTYEMLKRLGVTKVTVALLVEWTSLNLRCVQKIVQKNFKQCGRSKATYYEKNN
ncbi:nuclease-related domain-containing protein [Macrococcus animalis]|uniref:nuclease-related domain-containing protein n=1 Tax=Macrococcus animalis TaxID=3395467 RepID=UPI0039BE28C8